MKLTNAGCGEPPLFYISTYSSPLGAMTIESDEKGLRRVFFSDKKPELYKAQTNDINERTIEFLDSYFKNSKPMFDIPLNLIGTEFEKRIWRMLLNIPYGETRTYKDIASKLSLRSCQAVGHAIGKNPILIIIPCHRVIGSDGTLKGYSAGVERKRSLLELESAIC